MLASAKGMGRIILNNIECDPIITELVKLLNQMHANPSNFIIGPVIKGNMGDFIGIRLVPYYGNYYQILLSEYEKQDLCIQTKSFPSLYTELQPFISLYLHFKEELHLDTEKVYCQK